MFIYDIAIKIYFLLLKIVSRRNIKAAQMVAGHKDIFNKLSAKINSSDENVWFHAASLGEFEQGRPVIEEYRKRHPKRKILLTFFSPSGYEVRKNYEGVDYVFYLPFDTKSNVKKFLDIVNPSEVFFIKYEFWLNYMNEIRRRGVKFYIFSAIFSSNLLFFKWYGSLYRKSLKTFTHIFVQDEQSKTLLSSIGITDVTVAGDTRFDRVCNIVQESKELPVIASFKGDSRCFICGSSWEADDKIVCELIKTKKAGVKFIIAPHELGKQKIENLYFTLNNWGYKTVLYTESDIDSVKDANVLIINCIGILSSAYKYGDIAMIGGGFGVGIHNTLEAATFGLPMIFGENYLRFKEACDLVNLKVATPISDSEDAILWFNEIFDDDKLRDELSEKSVNYVKLKSGATDIILNY